MSLFGKKEKKVIIFEVAGLYFHIDEVKRILEVSPRYKNPSGSRSIFKYKVLDAPCDLVPEPKNKVDKNAVMVACGNVCVGYVPADQAVEIKKLIKKYTATIKISGGRYKTYDPEDDEWIVRESDFNATVTMTEK